MRTTTRWTLAAMVAAALSFGAVEAVAAPAAPAAPARQCNNGDCKALCKFDGARTGTCGGDQCICIY